MQCDRHSLEDKLQELLDGLKFYSERFNNEKSEILDDHDNFKQSSLREIGRLQARIQELEHPFVLYYNCEQDENYIKLITSE